MMSSRTYGMVRISCLSVLYGPLEFVLETEILSKNCQLALNSSVKLYLEASTLTGTGLFLDGLDLEDLVLEG